MRWWLLAAVAVTIISASISASVSGRSTSEPRSRSFQRSTSVASEDFEKLKNSEGTVKSTSDVPRSFSRRRNVASTPPAEITNDKSKKPSFKSRNERNQQSFSDESSTETTTPKRKFSRFRNNQQDTAETTKKSVDQDAKTTKREFKRRRNNGSSSTEKRPDEMTSSVSTHTSNVQIRVTSEKTPLHIRRNKLFDRPRTTQKSIHFESTSKADTPFDFFSMKSTAEDLIAEEEIVSNTESVVPKLPFKLSTSTESGPRLSALDLLKRNSKKLRYKQPTNETDTNMTGDGLDKKSERTIEVDNEPTLMQSTSKETVSSEKPISIQTKNDDPKNKYSPNLRRGRLNFRPKLSVTTPSSDDETVSEEDNYPESFKEAIMNNVSSSPSSSIQDTQTLHDSKTLDNFTISSNKPAFRVSPKHSRFRPVIKKTVKTETVNDDNLVIRNTAHTRSKANFRKRSSPFPATSPKYTTERANIRIRQKNSGNILRRPSNVNNLQAYTKSNYLASLDSNESVDNDGNDMKTEPMATSIENQRTFGESNEVFDLTTVTPTKFHATYKTNKVPNEAKNEKPIATIRNLHRKANQKLVGEDERAKRTYSKSTANEIKTFGTPKRRFSSRFRAPFEEIILSTPSPVSESTGTGDTGNLEDINHITITKSWETPTSFDLKLSESRLTPSHMINVETSNHSPSVTVSIFDALAEILTSTPKTTVATTQVKQQADPVMKIAKSQLQSPLAYLVSTSTVKPVDTVTFSSTLPSVLEIITATERTPANPSTIHSPAPTVYTVTPVTTSRKPLKTIVLFSTTETSKIDNPSEPHELITVSTSTVEPEMVYNTISDLLLTNKNTLSSQLLETFSLNLKTELTNVDVNKRDNVVLNMRSMLDKYIDKSLESSPLVDIEEDNTTRLSLETFQATTNIFYDSDFNLKSDSNESELQTSFEVAPNPPLSLNQTVKLLQSSNSASSEAESNNPVNIAPVNKSIKNHKVMSNMSSLTIPAIVNILSNNSLEMQSVNSSETKQENSVVLSSEKYWGLSKKAQVLKIIEMIINQHNKEINTTPTMSTGTATITPLRNINVDKSYDSAVSSLMAIARDILQNSADVNFMQKYETIESTTSHFDLDNMTLPENEVIQSKEESDVSTTEWFEGFNDSEPMSTTFSDLKFISSDKSFNFEIETTTPENILTENEDFYKNENIISKVDSNHSDVFLLETTEGFTETTTEPVKTTETYYTVTQSKPITFEQAATRLETNKNIPKKDFVIFGILPNNTVVRKNPNDDILEKITEATPFIIYGILPNNTIIRKFPNGTRVPKLMQKIEIVPVSPWSLRNPNSPVYKIPAIFNPLYANYLKSSSTNTHDKSTGNTVNTLLDDTVHITLVITPTASQMAHCALISQSIKIAEKSKKQTPQLSLSSHVLSLRTTTKLPSIDEILSNSLAKATKEEIIISSMTSSTEKPRILTLDIDPETKKIRTEKPIDGSGAVFKFIPIDEIKVEDKGSNVQKLSSKSISAETAKSTASFYFEKTTAFSTTHEATTSHDDSSTFFKLATSTPMTTTTQIISSTSEEPIITTTESTTTTTVSSTQPTTTVSTTQPTTTVTNTQPTTTASTTQPTTTTTEKLSTTSTVPATTTSIKLFTTPAPTVTTIQSTVTRITPNTVQYLKSISKKNNYLSPTTNAAITSPEKESPYTTLPNLHVSTSYRGTPYYRRTSHTTSVDANSFNDIDYLPSSTKPIEESTKATSSATPSILTARRAPQSQTSITTELPASSTFSIDEDIEFLKNLKNVVAVNEPADPETALANRIIALAVERSLNDLQGSKKGKSISMSSQNNLLKNFILPTSTVATIRTQMTTTRSVPTTTKQTTTTIPTTTIKLTMPLMTRLTSITRRPTTFNNGSPTYSTRPTTSVKFFATSPTSKQKLTISPSELERLEKETILLEALLKMTAQNQTLYKNPNSLMFSTTTKPATTPKPVTTAKPVNTRSYEEDLKQFEQDAKLLQVLLKATGQNPANIKIPLANSERSTLKPSNNKIKLSVDDDLKILQNLLASPSPLNEPYDSVTAASKPANIDDVQSLTVRPLKIDRRRPVVAKTENKLTAPGNNKPKLSQEDAKLLQSLIQLQDARKETAAKPNNNNLDDLPNEDILNSLLVEPVSTKTPVKLSTEYGKTNDALLAALLKEQGLGPSTGNSIEDQAKLQDLLSQVIVTPKQRQTTTLKPRIVTQRRPILDGLAWLWQQWRETEPGPGPTRAFRRPPPSAPSSVAWLGSGPFVGNAEETTEKRVPLESPVALSSEQVPVRGQLVSAAINVTRAFSQFLGAAIQGAAQTVQNVIKAGQKAASEVYISGSG